MRAPRMHKPVIAIVAATFLSTHALPAFAYLDPGTGSLLVQGIIGAVAFLLITVRHYWYRLKSFFGVKKPPDVTPVGTQLRSDSKLDE